MGLLPDIAQCLFSGLALGSIFAIVAVGFTIIFSSTEVVNFAQGEFVMLGAMLSYCLVSEPLKLPLLLAVPLAVAIALVVGMGLGWVLMRPLKKASPVSLIIITVGASMLLQGIASHLWGIDQVSLPEFTPHDPINLTLPFWMTHNHDAYPVTIQVQELWVMGLAALMVIGLTLFFRFTMMGKAMRAVAANRHGARLVGVNVSRLVMGAFALSAAMGAIAGAAVAPITSGQYSMGTMMGLKGFAAAIVGGLGSFPGSIIAGLFLGVLETFGARFLSSDYKDAFAFIILLVVLFVSPNGIPALLRRKAN